MTWNHICNCRPNKTHAEKVKKKKCGMVLIYVFFFNMASSRRLRLRGRLLAHGPDAGSCSGCGYGAAGCRGGPSSCPDPGAGDRCPPRRDAAEGGKGAGRRRRRRSEDGGWSPAARRRRRNSPVAGKIAHSCGLHGPMPLPSRRPPPPGCRCASRFRRGLAGCRTPRPRRTRTWPWPSWRCPGPTLRSCPPPWRWLPPCEGPAPAGCPSGSRHSASSQRASSGWRPIKKTIWTKM